MDQEQYDDMIEANLLAEAEMLDEMAEANIMANEHLIGGNEAPLLGAQYDAMAEADVDMNALSWSSFVPNLPPPTPTLDMWENLFTDMEVEIEVQALATCLDELVARWITYQITHGRWALVCAYRLFGLDPDTAVCDVDEVEEVAQRWKDICIRLYTRMEKAELIMRNESDDPNGKRVVKVLHIITSSASVLVANHNRFEHSTANHLEGGNAIRTWEAHVGLRLAGTADDINLLTTGQRLLLHVLEQAFVRNLRKYQGFLYRQVLTPGPDGTGMNRTHAWEMHSEILPFIYSCVDKHTDWATWCDLTSSRSNPVLVKEYITNSTDFELKTLKPQRHVFSFTNGVYNALLDKMYTYEEGIPTRYVAAKFFDVAMPLEFKDEDDFRAIPTPALDRIFEHQQLSNVPYVPPRFANLPNAHEYDGYSVQDWIYVFMGRMIYDIGKHDTWQALMFLKGKAGTGKSTIGKVLSSLYDAVDVGVLSNNTERQFGLSALVNKLIYICYEVKKDFALDQGEMQSMISGEPMSISAKFQTAQSVTWSSHGFFMGNEFPAWTNNSGSIGRRIVTVLFDHVVIDSNPNLFEELQEEMGRILIKINRAYRQCTAMYGAEDIWKLLPPYFEEKREKELEAHTHVLSAFLVHIRYDDGGKTLVLHPQGTLPMSHFRNVANDFINENTSTNPRKINWNSEFYGDILPRYGIRVEDGVLYGICEPNMGPEV